MKKKTNLKPWAVLFWLLVWQGASMLLAALYPHGHLLLASPISVLIKLTQLVQTAAFWQSVFATSVRIFAGFLASCALAVLLAALAARFFRLRELLAPLVATVKAVPVASFIILALVWLNSCNLSLFIAALMAFPPIYLNTLEGIAQTDRQLLEMAQVFRVSNKNKLRGIYLPQVMPYFRSAVSVAIGLCWKAGIAAEVIGLSSGSIGERLYTSKVYFETPELFAWTAVIVVLSMLLERLILALLGTFDKRAVEKWN